MICKHCAEGADLRLQDPWTATALHEKCDGKCDCAHKVEGEWLQPRYSDD